MAPETCLQPWPIRVAARVGQVLLSGLCRQVVPAGRLPCFAGNHWAEQEGRECGNPLPFASHSEST